MRIDVLKSVVTVGSYFHSIMNIVIVTEGVIPLQSKLTYLDSPWFKNCAARWAIRITFFPSHSKQVIMTVCSSCRLNVNTKFC
jgi:hypothetical protein